MHRWIAAGIGVVALAGCGEPGACAESVRVDSVRHGSCFEVDHQSQCPTIESGRDAGEFAWEFTPNTTCPEVDYPFDCGGGLFEDVEAQCAKPTR